MTKISLNQEQQEVEITRSIGKNGDGKITINREGGGAIEINLGVGKVGLTTDYGGAISLGIAGQEVTWGREGGTIHIGIGGLEVDVEARDCIVTEIKSIFGQIVAQRSYPDPGCKLPDPPTPTPPTPLPPDPSKGIKIPATEQLMWVPCVARRTDYNGAGNIIGWSETRVVVSNKETKEVSGIYLPFDMMTSEFNSFEGERLQSRFTVTKGTYMYQYTLSTAGLDPRSGYSVIEEAEVGAYRNWLYGVFVGFIDTGANIKRFLSAQDTNNEASSGSRYIITYKPIDYIIVGEQAKLPSLPTGNKPPMIDCCEEILDELADIKEAIGVERMLKDKFPVSNTFMAPECDPASVTEAKTFYEVIQCAFRMMAHGLIFEPKVMIEDADAAKAGDQELKFKYLNATGWASAVAEALLEVKDDGNVATNMDIRTGFATTQTMVGVAEAIYKLDAILDCLGITLMPKV